MKDRSMMDRAAVADLELHVHADPEPAHGHIERFDLILLPLA